MNSTKYRLKITFEEPLLGSQPESRAVLQAYVQEAARENEVPNEDLEDEAEAIPEIPEEEMRGMTIFHKNPDGSPLLYNFHIKGVIKHAASIMSRANKEGITNFKSLVEDTVFISPRRLVIHGEMDEPLSRPLQGMTRKGPRVMIAMSEQIKAGAWVECEVECIDVPKFECTEEILRELLDYGTRFGIGQWRSSHVYGTFNYTLEQI